MMHAGVPLVIIWTIIHDALKFELYVGTQACQGGNVREKILEFYMDGLFKNINKWRRVMLDMDWKVDTRKRYSRL
eukprot:scaffold46214_cov60-Attheya_sp.AAC.6